MEALFNDTHDVFNIFDGLDHDFPPFTPKSCSSSFQDWSENELEMELSPKRKRGKIRAPASEEVQEKVSHIAVERNRRKQMNEHLSVLRSLMPCFYVKRGDQASIIGGVVDYINELQQILNSLEAKKQRKVSVEVMCPSPRVVSSPRPSPMSPRKPPNLPISPRTPQPTSPYKPRLHHLNPKISLEPSLTSSASNPSLAVEMIDSGNELVANSNSSLADVEVKFSGSNLLLKTVSPRVPGQAFKIISALEGLSLEVLHVGISTVEEALLVNSFTVKIGIECRLSAQELAQQIQKTFC